MKKTLTIFLMIALSSFNHKNKPVMIQDWELRSFSKNAAGQIVDVKYVKVGKPYLMPDSSLQKTVHTIIND